MSNKREREGCGSGYEMLDEYEGLVRGSSGMSVSSRFLQD